MHLLQEVTQNHHFLLAVAFHPEMMCIWDIVLFP